MVFQLCDASFVYVRTGLSDWASVEGLTSSTGYGSIQTEPEKFFSGSDHHQKKQQLRKITQDTLMYKQNHNFSFSAALKLSDSFRVSVPHWTYVEP